MYKFVTPIGRIVGGDLFRSVDTFRNNKTLTYKDGRFQGQYREVYYINLAISKQNTDYKEFSQIIQQCAYESFKHLFSSDGKPPKGFDWKITDGDSKHNITNNKKRIGYKDCFIVNLSCNFKPRCYQKFEKIDGGDASDIQSFKSITDSNDIRIGDYVRVSGEVKSNSKESSPGLYINFSSVELCGYGKEIVIGKPPNEIFNIQPEFYPLEMRVRKTEECLEIEIQEELEEELEEELKPPTKDSTGFFGAFNIPGTTQSKYVKIPDVSHFIDPPNVQEFVELQKISEQVESVNFKRITENGEIFTELQLHNKGWSEEKISALKKVK